MTKIKVYKGNGVVIPIDEAEVSTAFKCPWTNKVFSNKKSYIAHLKVLREDRIHREIRAKNENKLFEELINQTSFDDIINWIETHPGFFFDRINHDRREGWRARRAHLRDDFKVEITLLELRWNDMASNSHSCPRGGRTCWSSADAKDGRPRGYPGWTGRIEFKVSHDLGFGSDIFRNVGINTGSGGGIGNGHYGYGVTLFASDWPGLEKARVFEILKENTTDSFLYGKRKYFA